MNPQTVSQFRVTVPNLPGELAKITRLLLKANVNITGMMTESLGDVAHVRLLATPERETYALLDHAGFDVLEVPVFQLELPNKPGRLDRLARLLGEESINILCVYGTGAGDRARLILAVDDVERARPILTDWAEAETAPKARAAKH
jgi:hypothetical protein